MVIIKYGSLWKYWTDYTDFLFTVFNDHMDICDVKYLLGNESKRSSNYVSIDDPDWQIW